VKEKELLNVPVDEPLTIYEPVGCAECNDAGYRGRIGVYELMEVTPELKRIIARDGSAEEIKNQALKDGMSTLRMSAGALVVRGITSMNEMMKVSFDS
jgi:type IV pilus assembly protein PilB